MPLTSANKADIIKYSIERAYSTLQEAKDIFNAKYWNLCANRLYYSLFYAVMATLLQYGFSARTHSGMIHLMGDKLGRAGYLSKEELALVARLQQMRQAGDYDDMFDWTKEDIEPLFPKTEALIDKLRNLIARNT